MRRRGGRWNTGERFGGNQGKKCADGMHRPKEFPANPQPEDNGSEEESMVGKMPPTSDDEE